MDFTHKNLTIEDIKRIKGTNGRSSFYKIKFKEFNQKLNLIDSLTFA